MHIHKCINIHICAEIIINLPNGFPINNIISHICAQPAASVFADVYVGVKTHLCSVHTCPCTSVQNTCSKVHVTLTAKECAYTYTHTHMHTHTYVHERTCACITPFTRWSTDTETHNLCTNMHTHTHTHVYKRIHIHIHTHMHKYICIHVRTHTHIHIYTHTHTKSIYERTQSTSETTAWQQLTGSPTWHQEAVPFSLSAAIQRGVPFVTNSPLACPRGTMDKRRTNTTNSSSSHHHDSAQSRPHPLICTGAEPIHPVDSPSKLPAWLWPPRNEVSFLPFWRVFSRSRRARVTRIM